MVLALAHVYLIILETPIQDVDLNVLLIQIVQEIKHVSVKNVKILALELVALMRNVEFQIMLHYVIVLMAILEILLFHVICHKVRIF